MLSLGVDIGGTKMEVVVLDAQGTVIYKRRHPTIKNTYSSFFNALTGAIEQARQTLQQPLTIGICLPGTVETSNGQIKNSNILTINQQPLPAMLEQHCRQPVAISNDANCFTLSEAIDGAGKDHPIVFGAILGTGCGGGISYNHQLLDGRNRCAGEWGHNALPRYTPVRDGPAVTCYCGQQNCIESFVSGTGLALRFNQRYQQNLNAQQIMEKYQQDDKNAVEHIELVQDQLARSLASIVNVIDPDIIVIGGGLSNSLALYQDIAIQVARYVFSTVFTTPIVQAIHGDSSGVRGAAWLGRSLAS